MVYRVEGKTRRGRQRARELEKKKKNNSARVNERESTGRGEKNLVFFFLHEREKSCGENFISRAVERKNNGNKLRVERSEKEKIIYSNDCERERDRRRKSILAVSIYFSCFSTLRFSLGNVGRKRGE